MSRLTAVPACGNEWPPCAQIGPCSDIGGNGQAYDGWGGQ